MKRYLAICLFGAAALSVLIFFYIFGENPLIRQSQEITKMLLTAKNADAELESNLLKSRGFLNLSYDELVQSEVQSGGICEQLKSDDLELYGPGGIEIRASVDEFCEQQKEKLADVERFKSKNAIFRNSLYFLQKMSSEQMLASEHGLSRVPEVDRRNANIRAQLIEAALSYALIPTPDSRLALKLMIKRVKHLSKRSGDLESIAAHADRIYETKEAREVLTLKVLNSSSNNLLKKISELYFARRYAAESLASGFRTAVIFVCAALTMVIVFGIFRLRRGAQALVDANLRLESRVEERTADLKRSQELVTQQQQILSSSAKMSALGEMAGGVAHEINTPLAIISMRVEQMEERLAENDLTSIDFAEAIESVKKTTDRIAKIVSGLRSFAREEKHAPTTPVAVGGLIQETLSLCQEKFANHGVALQVGARSAMEGIEIECRSIEISQVLLNLLNNSFDAISGRDEKWIRIEIRDENDHVEISVTDSGNGIPIELQEKLMQPFFTTKEIGKGTGLGLSISRGIVTAHGGTLELDTTGPNTRFHVRLPKPKSGSNLQRLKASA